RAMGALFESRGAAFSVASGSRADAPLEYLAEAGRIRVSATRGDRLPRLRRVFEELPGLFDADSLEPAQRRFAEGRGPASLQGAKPQRRRVGPFFEGNLVPESLARPGDRALERRVAAQENPGAARRAERKLASPSPLPNEDPRDFVRDRRSPEALDEMEAEVYPREEPSGAHDVPVVDYELRGDDADIRA